MCFYDEHEYYKDLEAEARYWENINAEAETKIEAEAEAEAMNQERFKLKKPIYDYKKHLYICPNCGKFLHTCNEHKKYSMCCGQLLDWN